MQARYLRSATVRNVLDAVTAEPGADHSLSALAARAGVGVRHPARLVRREAKTHGLLEAGTDPLDVVARRSGFGSAGTMRRAFVREPGSTPGACRARFGTNRSALSPAGPEPAADD